MDRTDIHERDLMRMRRMAGLLVAGASDPHTTRESLELG